MFGRVVKGVMAAAVGLSLVSGIVMVAEAQTDVIKARQDNRKALTGAGRELRRLIDSNADGNAIAAEATKMADLGKAFAGMFPPGSDKGDTLAAPAIWTDRAGFDKINQEQIDAAMKLAALAKAGTKDGLMDQYRAMGKTCGDCHRAYATKDPFKK